jgi:hypothetical protein
MSDKGRDLKTLEAVKFIFSKAKFANRNNSAAAIYNIKDDLEILFQVNSIAWMKFTRNPHAFVTIAEWAARPTLKREERIESYAQPFLERL